MSRRATNPDGDKASTLLVAGMGAIIALTAIAYLPLANAGFIWDDDSYVTANALVQDPSGLAAIWMPGNTPQYYPLVFTSFWIEHALWGLDPAGYHIINLVLHITSSLLVWRLFRVLGLSALIAFTIGLLFAVHPVHVESVAWITERKNVLSGVFYLTATLAYLRFDRHCFQNESGSWIGWYIASLLLFICAMLSKTVTCSLPAALILGLLFMRVPLSVKRLLPLAPMFILGLVGAVITASLERDHVGAFGADFDQSFIERILIASRALLFYPWKILWPSQLMFIYPRWSIDAASPFAWLFPAAVLAIALVLLVSFFRRRGLALAAAFYAGTILPALGFINVYPHRFSFVADHFNYLASLGIIALVVGSVASLTSRRPRVMLAFLPIAIILATLTFKQTRTYESEETVWRDTIAKNPTSWMPNLNLGAILLRQAGDAMLEGSDAFARQLATESLSHLDTALEQKPDAHTVHSNRSEALRLLGRNDEAIVAMRKAIDLAPHRAENHWKLARLLETGGKTDAALDAYAHAADAAPQHIEFALDHARLLVQSDRLDDAAAVYARVLNHDPTNIPALAGLASIHTANNDHAAALHFYDLALAQPLTGIESVQIVPRVIRLLASCPSPDACDPARAVALAQQLNDMTTGMDPASNEILAYALAADGRHDEAIAAANRAITLAEQSGLGDFADEIRARLDTYRAPDS